MSSPSSSPLPPDPFLHPSLRRYSLFPIQHHDIYQMYKKHEASFWTAEEIDLSTDKEHWKALTDDERHFIKHVLAFFAASDGPVADNIVSRFAREVPHPEVSLFYNFQAMMEGIHNETYGLLIDTYIQEEAEKERLFASAQTIPVIQRKMAWVDRWIHSDRPFAERLLAFAVVEGIFFSGSFCAIYFMKKRGLLPGLSFSNDLISRDEGLHRDFAVLLYEKLAHRCSQERVYEIVKEGVALEIEFVKDALPVSLIGMSEQLMSEYVMYVSDHLLLSLGYPALYKKENPFEWMTMISLPSKINFFERRNASYMTIGLGEQVTIMEDF